jgi:hypothetical protein
VNNQSSWAQCQARANSKCPTRPELSSPTSRKKHQFRMCCCCCVGDSLTSQPSCQCVFHHTRPNKRTLRLWRLLTVAFPRAGPSEPVCSVLLTTTEVSFQQALLLQGHCSRSTRRGKAKHWLVIPLDVAYGADL